jgi:hypothetical protein
VGKGGRSRHGRRFDMSWACPDGRDKPTINTEGTLIHD